MTATLTDDNITLQEVVSHHINDYLDSLGNEKVSNLYDMFLEQIEIPLLEAAMEYSKYNQVRAAKTLGISRGTLRTKLIQYFDDKYCEKRK